MLEQSQHEVPDDFNPPARLARAYLALRRPRLANAAVNQALSRCAGPRKLRLFLLKADIFLAQHEPDNARATLRRALQLARDEPPGSQSGALRKRIERKLAELS